MSHTSDSLAIYLLGPARIEHNGQAVEVETRKASALLAYLALHPERLSRDQLATFFWPEYDQERAYANLRRTLWALNKALGEGWIVADNLSLALHPQAGLWVDVLEFQRLLAQCRTHGHRSDEVCPACLEPLEQAVSLVRGDFLEGFSLRDSAAFDDWHFFEAESLRKAVAASLEKLVRGHSSQQEDETAIGYARRWLALDPLHEPVHCWLMQLYAWTGQPASAARQYQECVRVLKAELDAPPEAETTALYNRISNRQITPRPAKSALSPIVPSQSEAVPVESKAASLPTKEPSPAPTAEIEDELRMVTVLCAALTEPLSSTPSFPNEQSAQRMRRIFQVAEEILLRYDGRVERILGEGVVALFGTRQQHEDDPERAVRAALDLRQAAQNAGLLMSAGISSGHVYLSRQGTNTTTIGPVVNLALRLQNKADSDQLLVSESIYRQTRGVAVYTPLSLALQSNVAPLPVYQIERLQSYPQKLRGIAGLRAPLVGRTKELSALQDALAAVQNGEGQIITLIGDAGVGKSRLIAELKLSTDGSKSAQNSPLATRHPHLWFEGRCLEMSMAASYWPFLDILRTYLGWQPEEAETSRAGRVVSALDVLVTKGALTAEQREEMGPLLGNLLAVRFGNEWDNRLKFAGPEQIRYQTLMTLRDLFVALAQQQPVVLVLEDLHWADSLSLDLITLLMETLPKYPLLLLCVYRPERQHRCWQLTALAAAKCPDHFSEVRLRELTPRQSQQLVEALLTIENLAPKVKTTILQKAQGNPLFVEEVIRSLIDAGIVYRQGEVWQAHAEIENVVVPETVQSVILSRVDRLGETLKEVLQRAAVIGRVFSRPLLAQLAPPGLDLDNAVVALTNHALIYQERVVPEEEYSFKHVLVQEAVYQTTLAERRAQFHWQVGEAMEQLYADNLAERYEQLAYHYDRSGVTEKAAIYLIRAGEQATRRGALSEAQGFFDRVLQVLPVSEREQRAHALYARITVLERLGEPEAIRMDVTMLLALAKELGNDSWLAKANFAQVQGIVASGDFPVLLQVAEKTIASAQRAGDHRLAALGLVQKMLAHTWLLQMAEAHQAAKLALAYAQEMHDFEIMSLVAIHYVYAGDLVQAIHLNSQAAMLAQKSGDQYMEAISRSNLGHAYGSLGLYEQAKVTLQQVLQLHKTVGSRRAWAYDLQNLGWVCLRLGDDYNAEQLEKEALAELKAMEDTYGCAGSVMYLAQIAEGRGDFAVAAQSFAEAWDSFQRIGLPGIGMDCIAGLARCWLAMGQLQNGQQYATIVWQHLMASGAGGMETPILAYLSCVDVFAACGEVETARAALEAGYRELMARAEKIGDPTWRQSFLENVAEHHGLLNRRQSTV